MSQIITKNIEQSLKLGERVGSKLIGGEVIELIGDIGAGKTTFVKGLARGIGSQDHVTSPTFTLIQVYNGRINLHHFDLYRLDEPGILAHDIAEILRDPKSVVVIEWSHTVAHILPKNRIIIKIKPTGEDSRSFEIQNVDIDA